MERNGKNKRNEVNYFIASLLNTMLFNTEYIVNEGIEITINSIRNETLNAI